MISKWIARGILTGERELPLTKAQLAWWHVTGARLSLESNWNTPRGRDVVQLQSKTLKAFREKLEKLDLDQWPTGPHEIQFGDLSSPGWKPVVLPSLEVKAGPDGTWWVPIIPDDPGHCLDAWTYGLDLGRYKVDILRPVASVLADRMQVRCEMPVPPDCESPISWSAERLALALLGGKTMAELEAAFASARRYSVSNPPVLPELRTDARAQAQERAISRAAVLAFAPVGKPEDSVPPDRVVEMAQAGGFAREASLSRVHAMRDLWSLRFSSRYTNGSLVRGWRKDFELMLSSDDLAALARVLQAPEAP